MIEVSGWFWARRYLDLKETDKETHNLNESVQPEDGRLRPHSSSSDGFKKGFKEEISAIIDKLKKDLKSEEMAAIHTKQSWLD